MDAYGFDDIRTALRGTTVLTVPRVSRETIVSVLQSHTELISGLRKDHVLLTAKVGDVETRISMNSRRIDTLEDQSVQTKEHINTLFRLSNEFRQEMDELSQKVAELYVLKRQMADQQAFVDGLARNFETFTNEVGEYMKENTKQVETLQRSNDDTVFQLKEMKNYVDHFADNLILNSQQIMVDPQAGFGGKPANLTDVLRLCSSNFLDIEEVDKLQDEKIGRAFSELETKAPDSVLFNVSTLEKKVATIELHIKKEEEQGLGALRKTCEELTIHMQTMQTELADKIDRESAGFMVHEKYEEIVKYLQEALQSSLEDENNFKEKSDQIQEMVMLLSNSKADRAEIANLQEVMVKSEALLKKVGAQANFKEKLKDLVSRDELDELLSSKVDRSELSSVLRDAVVSNKAPRKQVVLASELPGVLDEAVQGSASLKFQAEKQNSAVSGMMPVMALGQGLGDANFPRSSDFSSFLKSKGQKKDLLMSKSINSLPSGDIPGAFRKATESGRPGGEISSSPVSSKIRGYGSTEYPFLNQTGVSHDQDDVNRLAFVNGPLVGGGFNARSAQMLRGSLASRPVAAKDVEGQGLMLSGSDGNQYYMNQK